MKSIYGFNEEGDYGYIYENVISEFPALLKVSVHKDDEGNIRIILQGPPYDMSDESISVEDAEEFIVALREAIEIYNEYIIK